MFPWEVALRLPCTEAKGPIVMDWHTFLVEHHVKFVSLLLVWAAYIDGKQLRVPNWLTFPMFFAGLLYGAVDRRLGRFRRKPDRRRCGIGLPDAIVRRRRHGGRRREIDGRHGRVRRRHGDVLRLRGHDRRRGADGVGHGLVVGQIPAPSRQRLPDLVRVDEHPRSAEYSRRSPPNANRPCGCCPTAFRSASARSPIFCMRAWFELEEKSTADGGIAVTG